MTRTMFSDKNPLKQTICASLPERTLFAKFWIIFVITRRPRRIAVESSGSAVTLKKTWGRWRLLKRWTSIRAIHPPYNTYMYQGIVTTISESHLHGLREIVTYLAEHPTKVSWDNQTGRPWLNIQRHSIGRSTDYLKESSCKDLDNLLIMLDLFLGCFRCMNVVISGRVYISSRRGLMSNRR